MNILKVAGRNPDFVFLCEELEKFQYNMLPVLKEKDYSLTNDLDDVEGFILYVDNKPIGSIGLKRISKDVCEIVRVFVHEDYRGRGYAKTLFKQVEDYARLLGFKKAQIVAWAKATTALKLYQKQNYTMSEEKLSEWYGGHGYYEFFKHL